MDISITTILFERVLLAAVLGGLVGAERDYSGRPAGIRTNLIISISSCLFTVLSIVAFGEGTDPSRVASQIVVGVGFLGAGALIHQKEHVSGLTTAADIWLVAAIGMAVGVGYFTLAILVTAFIILSLMALSPLSYFLVKAGAKRRQSKAKKGE